MLVQLTGSQVANYWDVIEESLVNSMPAGEELDMSMLNRLLAMGMEGGLQVWVSCESSDAAFVGDVHAILTTTIGEDKFTKLKMLEIYSLYAYKGMTLQEWHDGMETLGKYARYNGCAKVLARSNVPGVLAIAKRAGANTDFHLILFDL